MIVKSKGRKDTNFAQLINYVLTDKGRTDPKDTFTIFHNTASWEKDKVILEFVENDSFRKKRKNGVVMHHEILSFSPQDQQHLSAPVLEDIAEKYIELRGANALCVAKPHIAEEHIHLHFVFSGNELFQDTSLRLSKKEFKDLRLNIEAYQLQQYPQIQHSHKFTEKHLSLQQQQRRELLSPNRVTDAEIQLKKRSKTPIKEQLKERVQSIFKQASSFDTALEKMSVEGLEVYQYRQKANGIIYNNKKYRFTTLGISKERINELIQGIPQEKEQRKNSYQDIRNQKQASREITPDLRETSTQSQELETNDIVQKRMEALRKLRQEKAVEQQPSLEQETEQSEEQAKDQAKDQPQTYQSEYERIREEKRKQQDRDLNR